MPRKKVPKFCGCGCGDMTKGGEFLPGHDAKLLSAIVASVGGIANLRDIVEEVNYIKRTVNHSSVRLSDTQKICPECGHVFIYGTWGGIDAHWRAHHEDVMPYEKAWPLIKNGAYKRMLG